MQFGRALNGVADVAKERWCAPRRCNQRQLRTIHTCQTNLVLRWIGTCAGLVLGLVAAFYFGLSGPFDIVCLAGSAVLIGQLLVRKVRVHEPDALNGIWLEDVDSQYSSGLYFDEDDDEDLVDYMSRDFLRMFSTPEVRDWWRTTAQHEYRPSFIAKMNKHIDR